MTAATAAAAGAGAPAPADSEGRNEAAGRKEERNQEEQPQNQTTVNPPSDISSSDVIKPASSTTSNDGKSQQNVVSSSNPSSASGGSKIKQSSNKSGSSSSEADGKRESFTAETPYFGAYVDRELRHLTILSETLYDISARARAVGQSGTAMADANRKLSLACKLLPTYDRNGDDWVSAGPGDEEGKNREKRICEARTEAVGKEMGKVLRILGEVLDEIADAQMLMCESLDASLSMTLEAFANVELEEVTKLKAQAEKQTASAEAMFARYLQKCTSPADAKCLQSLVNAANSTNNNNNNSTQGDQSNNDNTNPLNGLTSSSTLQNTMGGASGAIEDLNATVQAAVSSNWKTLSDQAGFGSFFGRRLNNLNNSINNNPSSANKDNDGTSGSGGGGVARRLGSRMSGGTSSNASGGDGDDNNGGMDEESIAQQQRALESATMRKMLEEIRLAQAQSELKRFHLLRRLDSLKTRRNFELGESGIASLNGIRAYFHHCSDLTQSLIPRLARAQEEQNVSREKHESQQRPWEKCETSLKNAIQLVEASVSNASVITDAIKDEATSELGQTLIARQPSTLGELEDEVELWDMPRFLAECSLYYREPKPGVIMEGWLYKKTTTRISTSWAKRWFILDKTGVYYMRQADDYGGSNSGGGGARGGHSSKRELVKVCDILLCTVREVPLSTKGVNGCRFCFEIISPNHKAYMLQAPGPAIYTQWIRSIRQCIERQLVSGKVNPSTLTGGSKTTPMDRSSLSLSSNRRSSGATDQSRSGHSQSTSSSSMSGMHSFTASTELNKRMSPSLRRELEPRFSFLDDFIDSQMAAGGHPFMPDDMTSQRHDEEDDDKSEDDNNVVGGAEALSKGSSTRLSQSLVAKHLAQDLMSANPSCADCGRAGPDWASLNLGILLCIECSGIHRSLGVHVSKIRSVLLDDISRIEGVVLRSIGNKKSNSIWEAGIAHQTGWTKPDANSERRRKEDFIKSKYQWRGFIEYSDDVSSDEKEREAKYSKDVYDAAQWGDLWGIAEALAKGGSVLWKNKQDEGKTALHACFSNEACNQQHQEMDDQHRISTESSGGGEAEKEEDSAEGEKGTEVPDSVAIAAAADKKRKKRTFQSIVCAEFLIQNGAKLSTLDDNDHTVLDFAVCNNAPREIVEFITARCQ